MGHGSAWTEEEDAVLAKCWLSVSCDPITGRNQKLGSFWSRIFELFVEELKKKGNAGASDRTSTACQNRWSVINRDVNKFVGILTQLRSQPKSGWVESDYLKQAMSVFHSEQAGVFRYMACG